VAENCRGARWGCIECKRVLADNMSKTLAPIRERAQALTANGPLVSQILDEGMKRASARAEETILEVRRSMGLFPPSRRPAVPPS